MKMMLRNNIKGLRRVGLNNFLSVSVLTKNHHFIEKLGFPKKIKHFHQEEEFEAFRSKREKSEERRKRKNKEDARCTSLSGGNQVDGSPSVFSNR